MIKLEHDIFREDSRGRNFKYVDGVSNRIKRFIGINIEESNLSRIKQHIDSGCMMISASRGNLTQSENKKRTDELANDLKKLKYGYIRVLGGYIETDENTGDKREVTEESFFVPKPKNVSDESFFDNSIKLCKKYNQDSVLISLPDYTEFGYYNKSGEFDFSPGSEFIANDKQIGMYFSQLVKGSHSNRKFAFQDIEIKNEWLKVRNPSSSYQAAYMINMYEFF